MPRQNDTMALPPLNSMQYDKQKESFISDLKQFHASRRYKHFLCSNLLFNILFIIIIIKLIFNCLIINIYYQVYINIILLMFHI